MHACQVIGSFALATTRVARLVVGAVRPGASRSTIHETTANTARAVAVIRNGDLSPSPS